MIDTTMNFVVMMLWCFVIKGFDYITNWTWKQWNGKWNGIEMEDENVNCELFVWKDKITQSKWYKQTFKQ